MGEISRDRRLAAYNWAASQMKEMFPNPDRYNIKNLKNRVEKLNSHISLFRGEKTDPVIVRVYWKNTNSVKYSIVDNYNEMRRESADMVDLLERNGIYVFEQSMM